MTVTAPDGTLVPVSFDIEERDDHAGLGRCTRARCEFDAPSTRRITDLGTDSSNPTPTTVVVARSLGDAIRGVLVWFGVGALGRS